MNEGSTSEPLSLARASLWPDVFRIAIVAPAYFAAHRIAFLFPDAENILAAIWPAGGIGLAALLLCPRRLWPAILAALFVAGNSANLLEGRPLFNSIGFMTANVLESLACAWLIIRWCGEGVRFNRVKDVAALIGAATMVNACTALIGAGTAALGGAAPFWSFWRTWWIADGLGILIVAPLIVTWSTYRGFFPPTQWSRARWNRTFESGLFMVLWCAVAWLSFQRQTTRGLSTLQPYVLLALLTYAALRFEQRGVTLALVLLAAIALTSKSVNTGPLLWGGNSPTDRVLLLQMALACTAFIGLPLAASYMENKAAEQSAREDQARISALGDNLPNGMVYQIVREHDGSMRFLYVSAGVERLSGFSAEAVLRDSSVLYDQYVEEDRLAIATAEEASAKSMSLLNVVARMRQPGGAFRWMHLTSSPRCLPDGRILWDGIQLDITERKQAEEAYRTLVDHSLQGLLIVQEGRIVFANQALAEMSGYTIEELLAFSPEEVQALIHPEDRALVWERAQRRLAGEKVPEHYEFRIIRKDGTNGWVEQYAGLIEYKGKPAAQTAYVDITERKRAEEALRETQQLYEKIFRLSPEIIVLSTEAEGRFLAVNDAYERVTGYHADEIIGHTVTEFTIWQPPASRQKMIQLLDEHGIVHNLEVGFYRSSGEPYTALLSMARVDMGGERCLINIIADISERKQAEDALRESEWRSKIISKLTTDYVFEVDVEPGGTLKLRWASENLQRITGRTIEDTVTPEMWESFIHPDDTARFFSFMNQVVTTAYTGELECRTFTSRGEERYIRVFAQPQTGEGNVVTTIVGAVQDITVRKHAEQELQRRDTILEAVSTATNRILKAADWQQEIMNVLGILGEVAVVDRANIFQLHLDAQGVLRGSFRYEWDAPGILPILDNPLAQNIDVFEIELGLLLDHLTRGQPGYFHVRDRPPARRTLGESTGTKTLLNLPILLHGSLWGALTLAMSREEREWSKTELEALQMAADMLGTVMERKQAEEALRVSEERHRLISELISDYAFSYAVEPDNTIAHEWITDDSFERITGFPQEEIDRRGNFALYHPEDVPAVQRDLERVLAGQVCSGEYRIITKSGELRWVNIYRRPVWDVQQNRVVRVYGGAQDITERKQAGEELSRYRDHLEELVEQRTAELQAANEQLLVLSRMKDEFVSNVSHELRTPITNLKLRQFLLEHHPDQIEQHLAVIKRETERLGQTIEDLLQLSRLDQKRTGVSLVPVDLNVLIGQYVADRTSIANSKNLALDFSGEPKLPEVVVDPGLIGQVLSILLTNAINYTPTGGQVLVKTHIRQFADRRWTGFSVSDTGMGIPPEDQPRLFTRFFRGKVGRASSIPGTGLGLAIAKEIVDQHDGRIEVESDGVPGHGTIFRVWIPREEKTNDQPVSC